MGMDDDDDYDIDYDLDDDEDETIYTLVEEAELDHGVTVYGVASVLFTGASEILGVLADTVEALGAQLAFLHNRNVDRERFIGSVHAGIERLDRDMTELE
jgi:hypothetical protein